MSSQKHDGKIKIPVLMYHEVSRNIAPGESHMMTPMYNISETQFESQVKALSENGYRSIFFEDVRNIVTDGKFVVLTFDDGLIGNVKFALPVLKKYNFKAVFFIAVGSVGSPGYMRWSDLQELRDCGMSVQSHTMTHQSLQLLDEKEIAYEMQESKRVLEDRLKANINAVSFPHGSYNQKVVKIAADSGYEFMCTSESACNFSNTFQKRPVVLGRVTITSKLSLDRFLRLVEYNELHLFTEKFTKGSKNLFKRIIGINNYRKLYRLFFNIKPSA